MTPLSHFHFARVSCVYPDLSLTGLCWSSTNQELPVCDTHSRLFNRSIPSSYSICLPFLIVWNNEGIQLELASRRGCGISLFTSNSTSGSSLGTSCNDGKGKLTGMLGISGVRVRRPSHNRGCRYVKFESFLTLSWHCR